MSTALVPIASVRREEAAASLATRACAGFVAHLIATAVQAPQTRTRRRAEPEDAVAAYRALGQWPSKAGLTVSRSL